MTHKPNFIIVGAPKCGTTAMSEYLRSHPNVFMSVPKEPNFFSSELGINRRSTDQYLGLFSRASPQHRVISEASTTYIFSRFALQRIRQFNSNAKIMVMIRRPSDLAYAFHGQCILASIETEPDFEKAWELQAARAAGQNLPALCPNPQLLQYKWIASIGSQVKKLFHVFPRNQVHVALLDDLSTDPRDEYLRLLSFLDLQDDGRTDFPKVNEARTYKRLWLGQIPRLLRRRFNNIYFHLKQKTRFKGTGLLSIIDRFNTEARPRPPLRPEFRSYLDDIFSGEVDLLQELLGRDLSMWRKESFEEKSRLTGQENVYTG